LGNHLSLLDASVKNLVTHFNFILGRVGRMPGLSLVPKFPFGWLYLAFVPMVYACVVFYFSHAPPMVVVFVLLLHGPL
jgi:hypothetical protein